MAIKKFNTVAGLSVGADALIDVIDSVGNVTANNLVATGTSDLGNIGNVIITGGASGYLLQTDGNGTLQWTAPNIGLSGSNNQIQFNNDGNFGASSSLTFDSDTNVFGTEYIVANTITASLFIGNAASLTDVPAASIVGIVANANFSETANTANTSTTANFSTYANYANFAGYVTENNQPNITDVGTLNSLTVANGVTATDGIFTFITGDGSNISNIAGANVTGIVSNANYATYSLVSLDANLSQLANRVVDPNQPNITSLGNLGGLVVLGNSNLASVSTDLLTANGLVSNSTLYVAGDATIAGNFIVQGNAIYANVKSLVVQDPIIEQGGNTNGDPLTNNDGFDRGQLLHYYTSLPIDAFMGWKNLEQEFAFASNVSVVNNVATIHEYGNVHAKVFKGDGSALSNVTGANVNGVVANANYASFSGIAFNAGVITGSSQPNITEVGNLSELNVVSNLNTANLTAFYIDAGSGNVVAGSVIANNFIGGNVSGNLLITGDNRAVLFNNSGVAGSNGNFTFDSANSTLTVNGNIKSNDANLGNTVTANYFVGDGGTLSNISGSNVIGEVANANYTSYAGNATAALTANTVTDNSQPNITSLGILTGLLVSGNANANILSANYLFGDGSNLTNLTGSAVTGVVANANYSAYAGNATTSVTANTVTDTSQPNITSVGTLVSLEVTGIVNANGVTSAYFVGDGGNLSNITGINVNGVVANANYSVFAETTNTASTANTVLVNAQPNITSLGTLTSLDVSGNATANVVLANYFIGDGSNIYNLSGANVNGIVANANYAAFAGAANSANVSNTVSENAQPNITSVGTLTSLTVSGNISGNVITANLFSGNGSSLRSLPGANVVGNVSSATFSGFVVESVQSNITSLGNLTDLTVLGNTSSNNLTVTNTLTTTDATITGNLTIGGNTTYVNVNSLYIQDPIIQLGGGVNGAPLTTNDGKDRGTLLNYYTDSQVSAFMGWDNSNAEFLFASNVLVSNDIVVTQQLANIRADYIYGNFIGNITGNITIPGGNTEIVFNDDSLPATSPNFRFDSSNNTLFVVGDINATALNLTGNISALDVTANKFVGNLVGSATTATTVTASAQPNITSFGQLQYLDIAGPLTAYTADLGNLAKANYLEGTLTTAAQPSITEIGTLLSLNVTGNISSGNADLGNLVLANFFVGDGSGLDNINGSNVSEVPNATYAVTSGYAANSNSANVALTVSTNAQPNITSIGTLTGLSVAGMLTSFNAVLGNIASANYFAGDGSNLSNLSGANVIGSIANSVYSDNSGNALVAGTANTVTSPSQPNITSVGTLSSLIVNGNITSGNANLGNLATANYFIGDGGLLSNIGNGQFANYANYAGNATIAETANVAIEVSGNSQPNITSVGSLTELVVIGNITAGNVDGGNLVTANYIAGDGSYISNLTGSAVTGWVARANFANSAANAGYANAAYVADSANSAVIATNISGAYQPNITTIGTLVSLTVTGNLTANNATFGNSVSGLYFVGDGGNLSNLAGSNVNGVVANATYAETSNNATNSLYSDVSNTVSQSSQPNITSVGTLSSLDVSGLSTLADVVASNITVGNVSVTDTTVTATTFVGNFTSPGDNTSILFNNSGVIGSSNVLQLDVPNNILTVSGTVNVADSITRDGKEVPTYTTSGAIPINALPGDEWYDELNDRIYKYIFDGSTYTWIDITSGFISSNINAYGNTLVLRDGNGNIYANVFSGNSIVVSGTSELGSVGNIKISGGNIGYVLSTDGTGNLSWVDIVPTIIGGANTQVQFNNDGNFSGSSGFTFDTTNNTLSVINITSTITSNASSQPNITSLGNLVSLVVIGNLDGNDIFASNSLVSNSGYLGLSNAQITVTGSNANVFGSQINNLDIGAGATDVILGNSVGNVTARGTFVSNNLVISNLATITNLKVNDLYSNRTPIFVTTNTVVDSFPINRYRSARYTMRVNSDDGYQAVEVLLIHDGINSYVTVYGSLSTIGTDIISLSTAISSGNVQMLASTGSANTTVNLLGTYVAD